MGFEDIAGVDLFTDASQMGGGAVHLWIATNSGFAQRFRDDTSGQEDAILLQVCVATTVSVTYEDVLAQIALLQAAVPEKPIYLMPLDVSPQSSTCSLAGYNDSVLFVTRAVAEGFALLGPVLTPLYSREETRDGCHPNDIGASRMTETVVAWLESITSDA